MERGLRKDDASETPFIFNPYAAKRKSDARQEQQDLSRWVVGEECSLEVYISNPCSVQLKIERLRLFIEDMGNGIKVTPNSVAVVLPPKTKPTRVSLSLIPHAVGPLRVIGCQVTLFGITWLQRFVASLRKTPRMAGVSLIEPEWGTEKNMIVELDVLPSMPFLRWQFRKADSEQTWPAAMEELLRTPQEKETILMVTVRAGQRLDFKLRMMNRSKLPVLRTKLAQECKQRPVARELQNGEALCVEVNESQIIQKLPILPNDVIETSVRVWVGHKAAVSGISNNKDIPSNVKTTFSCSTERFCVDSDEIRWTAFGCRNEIDRFWA